MATSTPTHRKGSDPVRDESSSWTDRLHGGSEVLHSQVVMNVMIVAMIVALAALVLYGLAVEPAGGALGDVLGALPGAA